MVDARRIEGAGAPDDPVDFIALFQEQIREITPVLASNSSDQRFLHFVIPESRNCGTEGSRNTNILSFKAKPRNPVAQLDSFHHQ